MRTIALITSIGLIAGGCCVKPTSIPGKQAPAKVVATTQRTITYEYLLYLPPTYKSDNTNRWPLVIFLHGAGERGSDVNKVAAHGPPKQAAEGREFPFVLVSPQCPEDSWWDVATLQAMLDKILKEEGDRIDRDRIYVTGLSMGGGGTWDWISQNGNPFAAAASVCGASSYIPIRIKDPVPVWAFHGTADDVVPPWITTLTADQWKQAGGEVRVSMYEGVNHGSWERAYNEPELWDWLLSHKKQPATKERGKWHASPAAATQPSSN